MKDSLPIAIWQAVGAVGLLACYVAVLLVSAVCVVIGDIKHE